MGREESINVSVVVPLHDEQENIPPLYVQLTETLADLDETYELIFIDDGSRDQGFKLLAEIQEHDARVHVIRLRRRFGTTAALKAGFDFARGEIVVAMGDGPVLDPAEIAPLLSKMRDGYDVVQGSRRNRAGTGIGERISKRLMAQAARVQLHEFGTGLTAYRREVAEDLPMQGDMHRFLPVVAAWQGARVTEIELPERSEPRTGRGSALFSARTLFDFFTAKFLYDATSRPGHALALAGLSALSLGGLTGLYLLYQKLWLQSLLVADHGGLLLLTGTLLFVGMEMLSLGLAGEMLARTFFDAQRRPIYTIRRLLSRRTESEAADVRDADSSMQ